MPDRREDPPEVKVVDRRWWANKSATAEGATSGEEVWQPGKPTYVEELERQLAEKDRQVTEYLAKYREAAREFDESRARLRKDVAREVERGRRTLLVELLDVVDNLDRAIEAARLAAKDPTLLQGVEMVRAQFLAKLDGHGVRPLDAVGRAFDPARHEAAATVPVADASQDGLVVGVIRQGYTIRDEVLRPAVVAVAAFGEQKESS